VGSFVYADDALMATPLPSAPSRRDLVPVLLAGVGVVLAWWTLEARALGGRPGFPLDDSWIHLAFARSLAEGHGLAVNPGELVAGSTSPLWTALLSILFLLPGALPIFGTKLLGAVLYLATGAASWRLAGTLGLSRGQAVVAALATLGTGWLAWSALSGMEVTLFAFLSLAGLDLAIRERRDESRPPIALAVLGLAALARPEGLLLVVLAGCDRLFRFRSAGGGRPLWALPTRATLGRVMLGLTAAAIVVLPVVLFNVAVGGTPLPSTFVAKAGPGGARGLPNLHYLATVLGILFRPMPWATLAAVAGALALWRRRGTAADRGLLLALWVLGLPLAYSFLAAEGLAPVVGNFGRYYFPLLPALGVLGVYALAGLRLRGVVAFLGALVFLAPTWVTLPAEARLYATNVRNVDQTDVAMVGYLGRRLPPEAVIALVDLGAVSFFLPNPVLDLGGIANPEVPRYGARAAAAGGSYFDGAMTFLAERKPDYILSFPAWMPIDEARFPRVHAVRIPDNVTMAGSELVLYATPWTRFPLRPTPEASRP
jgi:hypothetical protein